MLQPRELERVRWGREAVTWLLWKEREASKAEQERGQAGMEQKPSVPGDEAAADLFRLGLARMTTHPRPSRASPALVMLHTVVAGARQEAAGCRSVTGHHALTQAIVTAHEAERGGDGVRGRRRRRTGSVLAPQRSASRMGSPARPGEAICFCKSSSSLWCPLTCETVVPKTAPGLAQRPLSPSSVLGTTTFWQRTSPAAPQPPHGQAGERPGDSQVAQAVEGTSPGGVSEVRTVSAAAAVVCLHLGQGVPGNCATSTALHHVRWGTGKIRGSKKAAGSCSFMWFQGRLVFNQPETRAGSGFSSGDRLRLCRASPHAGSAPSARPRVLPARRGRHGVMLSALS